MPEIKNKKNQFSANCAGFTLIELMVVVVILMLMSTFLSIDLAGRRDLRNLTIAQNELVSNIRQVESNTLSSQNLPSGKPVQFYFIKVDLSNPTRYTVQAVYNANTAPALIDVETINLPSGITFATSYPIVISGPGTYSYQSAGCALLGFKLPYEQIYTNSQCAGGPLIMPADDYGKIIYFFSNNPANTARADSAITYTLTNKTGTLYKTVTVSAVTGTVTFN